MAYAIHSSGRVVYEVKTRMDRGGAMNHRSIGFSELRDVNSAWRSVLQYGILKKYAAKAHIKQADTIYFVHRGQIRLTHYTVDGMEKILWYINEGCLFGEARFFDPAPVLDTYFVCCTPCEVYSFSRACLCNEVWPEHPELKDDMMHGMARKLRVLASQASSLYVDDVLARVCKFLSLRLVPNSVPLIAKPCVSRQEMASLLGVHRVTLYKVLRQQEEEGLWGTFSRHGVVILQPEKFQAIASL